MKEYKRSRERQQTAGTGMGVSGSSITNTLAPQQISDLTLDDTVMQVQRVVLLCRSIPTLYVIYCRG